MELILTLILTLGVFTFGWWLGYAVQDEYYVNQIKDAEKRGDEWRRLTVEALEKAQYFYAQLEMVESFLESQKHQQVDDDDSEEIVWN